MSLNTVSAQLTDEFGPDRVAATARRLGILSPLMETPSIALGTGSIPRLDEIALDGHVMGFALGITVVTGIVFGLIPAAHATVPHLFEALREGGRASGTSLPRRFRNGLVVNRPG